MFGNQDCAFSQWNAFDTMVNQSQDAIVNHSDPCITSDGYDLSEDGIEWKEDKDGYHAEVPISVPEEGDRKQLKARIMDGVLELKMPKKRLKSII